MKMFAPIKHTLFSFPAQLAAILLFSILLWSAGFPGWMRTANAASLSQFSDTLSDSDLSAGSNHLIEFTTTNGVAAGGSFTITFDAGFTVPVGFDFGDIDLDAGGDKTLGSSPSGSTWGVSTTSSTITFTSGTDTIASSSNVVIELGLNATGGNTQITNPGTDGSYTIDVEMPLDAGQTRVYIIDDVVVTASVDSVFTFNIDGIGTGATINDSPTTTFASTTSTLIPFGTLSPGTSKVLGQRIYVTTNAANGYSVTVQQDQNLTSAVGADIDLFIDGATTSVPVAWQAPSNVFNEEDTYGHFGITSTDATTSSSTNPNEWGDDLWAGNFDQPREILYHNAPSSGLSAAEGEGWADIGFQIQIGTLQEAANDYTNTLTYVATPVY